MLQAVAVDLEVDAEVDAEAAVDEAVVEASVVEEAEALEAVVADLEVTVADLEAIVVVVGVRYDFTLCLNRGTTDICGYRWCFQT